MRVLIVDDSRAVRNFVKAALKSVPETTIDEVDSGFEAFRMLARDSFDVLITDINMPDINGLELIRFVKKSARHTSTKILVITTQTTERMREKVEELGVDGFIQKPFEPETIIAAVLSFTKHARSQQNDSPL
jgi:two-component system chemotaxis response regulator CheY